jgi:hypothetical protein
MSCALRSSICARPTVLTVPASGSTRIPSRMGVAVTVTSSLTRGGA